VSCGGTIDSAHFSSGAGGVIYKTRITCKGTGSGYPKTVALTSSGALYFGASKYGTYKLRATSNYTQTATVNGNTLTFYTPRTGRGGVGCGYWLAMSSWSFPGSTVGSGSNLSYGCFY
jgi:hypothetical protein